MKNIFACLVHERPECVVDLIRNLHYFDPDSAIILYNGGNDTQLLDTGTPWERYGAVVHPQPHPLAWGQLHQFALDCMQYAVEHFAFDALTIVDSDQLSAGLGYSAYLRATIDGPHNLGMLSSQPARQRPGVATPVAAAAFAESDMWTPFIRKFPGGCEKVAHWTFWPSTVFLHDATRDLLELVHRDRQLQDLLDRTQIWASEEVVLPTLVALLGYEIGLNPTSYDYVRWQTNFTWPQIAAALERPDVYWIHPVARRYDDSIRMHMRAQFNHYVPHGAIGGIVEKPKDEPTGLLLTRPILSAMRPLEGWLAEDEADLLLAAASETLHHPELPNLIVEVGSYCGRSTVVLGGVMAKLAPAGRVYAIDPHEGKVGAADQGIQTMPPTLARFQHNLATAGVDHVVEVIQQPSYEVTWDQPIGMLLIDGLHDYVNVSRDFGHFEEHLAKGGYVAFHDYADYYPGVVAFVNELVDAGRYRKVELVESLIVLEKVKRASKGGGAGARKRDASKRKPRRRKKTGPTRDGSIGGPLVSCIMATYNRRMFVPHAIRYFLRQDYEPRELIVIDDGPDAVADLIPQDERIRYVRLEQRRHMGAKHNVACDLARGDIIAHWDDDDWVAPWRLTYQVHALEESPVGQICGLSNLVFYAPAQNQAWLYQYRGPRPWVCGNTFCYRKEFWRQHPHPDMNEGADTQLVWSLPAERVLALPDNRFLVAMVHDSNTSPKRTSDPRYRPVPVEEVRAQIGEDWPVYEELAGRSVQPIGAVG